MAGGLRVSGSDFQGKVFLMLEPVRKLHILLRFSNFGCIRQLADRFRRVTLRVALLNLYVFRAKFENLATKESFWTGSYDEKYSHTIYRCF